jgi:hypothetical protein
MTPSGYLLANYVCDSALTQVTQDTEILSVLVTPAKRAESGAFPHLSNVALWPLDDFKAWAQTALGVVRQLRRSLGDDCDLAWRSEAAAVFEQHGYDAASLHRALSGSKAADKLKR